MRAGTQIASSNAMASAGLACDTCGLVQRLDPLQPGAVAECFRCGSFLQARRGLGSLHVTAALSLAALLLYIPANIYPILSMSMYGTYTDNTIWDGVVSLARANQW